MIVMQGGEGQEVLDAQTCNVFYGSAQVSIG